LLLFDFSRITYLIIFFNSNAADGVYFGETALRMILDKLNDSV
jgi:hypothetical protein